jgi:hypothetical protein
LLFSHKDLKILQDIKMKLCSFSAAFTLLLLSPIVSSKVIKPLGQALSTTANTTSLNTTASQVYNNATAHLSKRARPSVKECLDKNKYWVGDFDRNHPYQIVCCAHSRTSRFHCLDYGDDDLRIEENGKCEKSPGRYNHGPYCAVLKYGSGHAYNIHGHLNGHTSDYGRFSREGLDMLEKYVRDYRKRFHCEQDPMGKWQCTGQLDWDKVHSRIWP